MPLAPVNDMTLGEIYEYVEKLEAENLELRAKTDNRKKLTENEVRMMRGMWQTGNWSQEELAEAFDVNPATVSRIVRWIYHGVAA